MAAMRISFTFLKHAVDFFGLVASGVFYPLLLVLLVLLVLFLKHAVDFFGVVASGVFYPLLLVLLLVLLVLLLLHQLFVPVFVVLCRPH